MKMHKSIACPVIAITIILAVILGVAGSALAQKPPIVVALIEPLSGPFKDVGTEVAAFSKTMGWSRSMQRAGCWDDR